MSRHTGPQPGTRGPAAAARCAPAVLPDSFRVGPPTTLGMPNPDSNSPSPAANHPYPEPLLVGIGPGRGLNSRRLTVEPARKASGLVALLRGLPLRWICAKTQWERDRLCTLAGLGLQTGGRLLRREGRSGSLRRDKVLSWPKQLRSERPSPHLRMGLVRPHPWWCPPAAPTLCFAASWPSLCVVFYLNHFAFSPAVLPRWDPCALLTLILRLCIASSETG